MKWENNRWGRRKWWYSSNIFINIMTWIESLSMMKGRFWGQTGGNVTKSVMIDKLSLNKLALFLQNRLRLDYVNLPILHYFLPSVTKSFIWRVRWDWSNLRFALMRMFEGLECESFLAKFANYSQNPTQ